MNTWLANIGHSAAILGIAAAATGAETAAADGQMRPDPPGVYSIYSPGPASSTVIAEQLISSDHGIVRVPLEPSEASVKPAVNDISPTTTVLGPNGQAMRVRPGVEPDSSAGASAVGTPPGAHVVSIGGAKALVLPNDATAPGTKAVQSPMTPGLRVVDLPPGAVAPKGMPEPMTLYRMTPTQPAPASADSKGH